MDQCFGHNARKGGGLYLLKSCRVDAPQRVDLVGGLRVPSGTNQGMMLGDGAFMSPALSYDGKTVLFAWASGGHEKWKKQNRFNIFRVNVDGSGLARLTDGDYDDFDPCWLPDGDIVFISTRRGGFGRCHPRPVPTYTLYSLHADGSGTAGIEGGTALPATQARLKIGDLEQSLPVTADMVGVTFSADLKAGPAILEGRFIDEKSGKWRSPFYVYVKRIGEM